MNKITRIVAVAALVLGLGSGAASAATGTIGTTGPNSNNEVHVTNDDSRTVDTRNRVRVDNDSYLRATTGDSNVSYNTTGGSAESGDAVNDNLTRATVRVDNTSVNSDALAVSGGSSDTGTINNTGPNSNNEITFDNTSTVDVTTDNNVSIDNYSSLRARSGDANVSNNTTGGDAVSGDATNINTSEFTITVSN